MQGPAAGGADAIVLRRLIERTDLEACVALQKETWGESFDDVTPPALLKVVQEVGGVAAGAFAGPDGRLEGFVFGVSGLRDGRPAHWSHMLAVRRDLRGRGLGVRLKRFQRELLLEVGIDTVYWTFDPLVARNAYLNLVLLGAGVESYVRDYYGSGDDSALSAGLGTDRWIVRWELASERVERVLEHGKGPRPTGRERRAPVLNVRERADGTVEPTAPGDPARLDDAPAVRVEIPADILAVRDRGPERAKAWRVASRDALELCLERGYRVETFLRAPDGAGRGAMRCWYLLVQGER